MKIELIIEEVPSRMSADGKAITFAMQMPATILSPREHAFAIALEHVIMKAAEEIGKSMGATLVGEHNKSFSFPIGRPS